MSYLILDLETSTYKSFKRKANPFDTRNRVITIQGIHKGEEPYVDYYKDADTPLILDIRPTTRLIVGHNIKFDLLYLWKHPVLIEFFKRGGKVWDTMFAEYMLSAFDKRLQQISLDNIVESYGGTLKDDYIKDCWDGGIQTIDIHPEKLIEYAKYDVVNTELVFLGQVEKARELGMLTAIMSRTESILCTTEMEYNGVHIDEEEGNKQQKIIQSRINEIEESLNTYLPELPSEIEFNWASKAHVSAFVFGGNIPYKKRIPILDEDGNECYTKAYEKVPNGVYKSGKNKGNIKYSRVEVKGEPKSRLETILVSLRGITEPLDKWETSKEGVYQLNKDVIEELSIRDIPFLKVYAELQKLRKDIGTYYWSESQDGSRKGLLTNINNGVMHHVINHTTTITGRQSGDLQQIPKRNVSSVKRIFTSRFGNEGVMVEADFSQLEIVCQGVLSRDPVLIQDLNNKIDFHCKRLAKKKDMPYEDVYRLHHIEGNEQIGIERSGIKAFSFARAYGAGAISISASTGIPVEEIQDMIEVEETMYSGVVKFYEDVTNSIRKSRVPTNTRIFLEPFFDKWKKKTIGGHYQNQGIGYHTSVTGTRYSFREHGYRGKANFSPTHIKNYPVQGFGGEIMQVIQGLLFRHFLQNTYNECALLVNTVHDCVVLDCKKEVLDLVCRDVKEIMQSVPKVFNKLYPNINITVPFPVEVEFGDNLYDMAHWEAK